MRVALLLVLSISISFGSLATSLVPTVENLLPIINRYGGVVHTITDDGRYGLDLTPLFEALEHAVQHRAEDIVFSTIHRNSLLLTGEYYFDPVLRTLEITLFLFNGDDLLFESRKIDITECIPEAIPNYKTLFDNGFREEQLCIKGVISDRINRVIRNGTLPDILLTTRSFKVVSKSGGPQLHWDERVLVQLLENQFGIMISPNVSGEITFRNDGSVLFTLGSKQQLLTDILPSVVRHPEAVRDGYLTAIENNDHYIYERVDSELPVEEEILSTIQLFFNEQYPSYFSHFSPADLRALFPKQNENSILTGTVLSDTEVRYNWRTPRDWVSRLGQLYNSGRRFDVTCTVREIIQDPHSQFRFWAVVDQKWVTRDGAGIELYQDDGFLLVNFDFTSRGELHNMAFHYRLWFYNYPYKLNGDIALTRENAILRDISDGLRSVHGMDISLKEQIKRSLLHSF